MKHIFIAILIAGLLGGIAGGFVSSLVGGNQSGLVGGPTRFPNSDLEALSIAVSASSTFGGILNLSGDLNVDADDQIGFSTTSPSGEITIDNINATSTIFITSTSTTVGTSLTWVGACLEMNASSGPWGFYLGDQSGLLDADSDEISFNNIWIQQKGGCAGR